MVGQALQRATEAAVDAGDHLQTYRALLGRLADARGLVQHAAAAAALAAQLAAGPPTDAPASPAPDVDAALARRLEGVLRIGQGQRGERRLAALHATVALLSEHIAGAVRDPASGTPTLAIVLHPANEAGFALEVAAATDGPAVAAEWLPSAVTRLPALRPLEGVVRETAALAGLAHVVRTAMAVSPDAMPSRDRVAAALAEVAALTSWPASTSPARTHRGEQLRWALTEGKGLPTSGAPSRPAVLRAQVVWVETVAPLLGRGSEADAPSAALVDELRSLASAVRNRGYSYAKNRAPHAIEGDAFGSLILLPRALHPPASGTGWPI